MFGYWFHRFPNAHYREDDGFAYWNDFHMLESVGIGNGEGVSVPGLDPDFGEPFLRLVGKATEGVESERGEREYVDGHKLKKTLINGFKCLVVLRGPLAFGIGDNSCLPQSLAGGCDDGIQIWRHGKSVIWIGLRVARGWQRNPLRRCRP